MRHFFYYLTQYVLELVHLGRRKLSPRYAYAYWRYVALIGRAR